MKRILIIYFTLILIFSSGFYYFGTKKDIEVGSRTATFWNRNVYDELVPINSIDTLGNSSLDAEFNDITVSSCVGCGGSGTTINQLGQIGDVSTSTLAYGHLIMYDGTNWQDTATSSIGLGGSAGTVTSVDMSVPTGLTIGGNPITTSGTLALSLTGGYQMLTDTASTTWDTAYTNASSSPYTLFVDRTDWTTIDNYPPACGAGEYASAIGDTLTCSAPSYYVDADVGDYITGSSTLKAYINYPSYKTISIASSTLSAYAGATASSSIELGVANPVGETWNEISCYTDAGTAEVEFGDGTNWMDYQLLTTSVGTDTSLSNNAFTTREKRYIRIGQTSGFNTLTCSVEIE